MRDIFVIMHRVITREIKALIAISLHDIKQQNFTYYQMNFYNLDLCFLARDKNKFI